jgi:alpha-glucosidase
MLHLPHHDGSSLYVSNLNPSLGDEVVVRLRVPRGSRAGTVWVRTVYDEEPAFTEAKIEQETATETWWYARISARNNITRYRWMLTDPYRWVTQIGMHTYDPTDASDFRLVAYAPPPDWAPDAIVYQIYPDRFARSKAASEWQKFPDWSQPSDWADPVVEVFPAAMTQMYGGDLDGVVEHIDHLRDLGVNTIYATPFFPAESNHRYNASSFDHVDELLGGDEAFHRMTDALHGAGIRFLGDLTTNHSGDTHDWFEKAQKDPLSPEASFYTFHHHPNDYEAWFGVRSLPKFDHSSAALGERMIDADDSIVAKYLKPPFDLDGWRIDVANMTGRRAGQDLNHDVARRLRSTMSRVKPDSLLIAEHCHDASGDLAGDGWYSTMNYSGFTNPVWSWLGTPTASSFFGTPLPLRVHDGHDVRATIDAFAAAVSWRSRCTNLNLLDSHDSARFLSVVGNDAVRQRLGATLLLTFPGIPSIFQGDEFGLRASHNHVTRAPIPWDAPSGWNTETLQHYRAAIATRRSSEALRRGGFRWVSVGPEHLAYLRETKNQRVLIVATRSADPTCGPSVRAALASLGIEAAHRMTDLLSGKERRLGDLDAATADAGAHVWELPNS